MAPAILPALTPGVLIEPDPAATAAYENVYQQYRALYPALKQIREKAE
jgi:sugar (pentulose or hexulose) kinase